MARDAGFRTTLPVSGRRVLVVGGTSTALGRIAGLRDAGARITVCVGGGIAAYKVIEGKGATNYAIGLAVADIMSAVLRDEHRFLPVSTLFTGQYGIDDVCLSAPCVVSAGGVAGPAELPLDETDLADRLGLASPVF